jgi:hypothetical protein
MSNNFDITVYDMDGEVVKNFYNFSQDATEQMHAYYTTNGEYIVRIEEAKALY